MRVVIRFERADVCTPGLAAGDGAAAGGGASAEAVAGVQPGSGGG